MKLGKNRNGGEGGYDENNRRGPLGFKETNLAVPKPSWFLFSDVLQDGLEAWVYNYGTSTRFSK